MLPLLSMVTLLLAMEVLATMARDQLTLSLKLMPVCIMEDMVLDMDILVLDMLDMDSDMEVSFMVKQLIYASKSSKVFFLLFSALERGRNFVSYVQINKHDFNW